VSDHDQLSTEVETLLDDLTAAVESQQSVDGDSVSAELAAVADRADELVAEAEIPELLAAVGLGETDARPESMPEAVASGDPQHVAALRSLLTVSKLPRSTADHEQLVDELGELVETDKDTSSAEETATESRSDSEETDSEAEASDSGSDTETKATDDDPEATESSDDEDLTASLRDRLQSELEDTLDLFDQISELDDLTADDSEDGSADAQQTDDNGEKEDDEDGDVLDTDQSSRSGNGTRWRPSGGKHRTTHSTISSTGRRDIGRSGRFSSMRGSTVSKR